jgi:hypothetical protein
MALQKEITYKDIILKNYTSKHAVKYQTSKEVAFNERLLSGGNRECGKFCFIIK